MLKLDEAFVPTPPKVSNMLLLSLTLVLMAISTYQPSGRESLVEKWILHKLNIAAAEVNRQLNERNFMLATSAAYNFWLYELCDVYIVRGPKRCEI
jgi:valyl-tRNA synthetase